MAKVHTTAVVIIPPKSIWGAIQDIRKKYDKQFHRWMPHITLLYPFRPESEFSNLEPYFSKKCKKIESFKIYFEKFKHFYHGKQKYTIWLDPNPENLIKSLQFALLEIVPDCNNVNLHKIGFIPHLSVGQVIGKDNLKRILKDLQNTWKPLKSKITSVYFIARERENLAQFKIKKEISLK